MMFEFRHITRLSVCAGAMTLAAAALCAGGAAHSLEGWAGLMATAPACLFQCAAETPRPATSPARSGTGRHTCMARLS